jgi:transcriptional regulator with XRE-family HTH domain
VYKVINTDLLKAKRRGAGISQEQFGEILHFSQNAYFRREIGTVPFTPEEIIVTAKALKLSLIDINNIWFGGELPI